MQSGELGTSDTTHRLQTTHSFWTSEDPVDPRDYPEFGIHGRDGKLYAWYGVGQSLLMLPPDIVGTYIGNLHVFDDYEDDPQPRSIVVSYTTNILVCVLATLVCFRLLGLLGFTANQRVAGALALLLCTTFLHYTQNMMENNYILLLVLTGLTFQYEWLNTGRVRALAIGSSALGLNLLTRLTTGIDLIAVGIFLPSSAAKATLVLAIVVAAVIWVFGEAFGGILTGGGTDPNSGPLLVLLALTYWPARTAATAPVRTAPAPADVSEGTAVP